MKNSLKLGLLPAAVTAALLSTNAFAGTEACFEVYGTAANAVVTNHAEMYGSASCLTAADILPAAPIGDGTDVIADVDSAKVAYELTGNYTADFDVLGRGASAETKIVYIPTTDIPPATGITMQLGGTAIWNGNANQLHLVHVDSAGNYQVVASSDGAFDGTSTVKFLTKAGITIGAGSRLAISQTGPHAVAELGGLLEMPSIALSNAESCSAADAITISAITAKTDSGVDIAGGVSTSPTAVLSTPLQFSMNNGLNASATVIAEVDAEDPSFRTQFVDGVTAEPTYVGWETKFVNQDDALDDYITLAGADAVTFSVEATSSTGSTVYVEQVRDDAAEVFTDATGAQAGGALIALTVDNNTDVAGSQLSVDTAPVTAGALATAYFLENAANGVAEETYIGTKLVNYGAGVMEFNYDVKTNYSLDLNNVNYLDQTMCVPQTPFTIGVNGAVLKVPYTYETNKNWIRITNEHTSVAQVFLDIFDESGNEVKNVDLGMLEAKTSEVYRADELIAMAKAADVDFGATTDRRHTMTFTVTAPKNRVHGVSVQTIPGGVDRVMPVLDQNDWSQ